MRCRPRWLSVVTGRAGRAALAAGLLLAAGGCRREVDLGRIYGPERAVTTVRYLGVRGETRLYPDYGAIDARILSQGPEGGDASGASTGPGKPGARSRP